MAQVFFWKTIRSLWRQLTFIGIIGAVASFFVLLAVAPRFQVSSDFLIVQNQSTGQDAYSAFKSLDYLGKVLNESAYSERFITAVVETGKVDTNFLPSNTFDRLKQWKKMVTVTRNADAGILHIEVRADDQKQALRISQAVSDVLLQKNALFRSGDENSVEVRILSGPVLESKPTMTEIVLSIVGGFLLAAFIMILWIFVSVANQVVSFQERVNKQTLSEEEKFGSV
jgi:capsular polysaccharide biosynthesis protein